ncbi:MULTISPECIES: response regulator [Flavobacteriaceae]|uniref:hybrid sensor histidine kinase/response regulator transcription factor n=1 Tax=Flavobacteriaceae TaxID=49546 RepID=UPI001490E564|nr:MULTISPECIES: response regulator [Allomuricauda]MDC6367248.1 response regulator [Muricauda sp. AC10]
MKKIAFIFFLFIGLSVSWSQAKNRVDSLRQLLTDTKNVEESVGLNEQLFVAYLYTSPDSADHYRKNIKRISENNNYIDGQYLYHSLSGRYHFAKSDIDSAFYHIEKASTIAEKLQNKLYLADCYKKIGVIYNVRRNDSLSAKYAHMALENAKQTDDWRILSSIYILLGNQNFIQTAYPEALTYYLKLDSIYTSQNKVDKSLAAAYNNIGMIYSELRNPKAVDYIKKSIEIYEGLGLEEGARYGDVALATYYDFLQEDKVAINHLLKAKKYYEEYGDKNMLGHIYGRLGSCYLQLNDFENAELYLIKVSSMPEASQDKSIKVLNQIGLGDLYSHKKQHQKAVSHFKNALELLQENDGNDAKDLQLFNIYKGLYGAYKDNNDYKNALNALEKKMELEASIQKSQNELEVEELNKKYQTDKQQQEIELLTSQSQLAAQKSKNQRNLLTLGLLILGLAFGTLFFLFRNKQKTNQRLKELESAKSKFFANISHEFRTPLTLISGPVAHQLSKDGLSTDDKTDLNLIQRNANRLLNLVNQLLELSKIEVGHRKLMVSKGNLELFLKYLVEPFQYQAERKGMVFKREVMVPSEAWFDRDIVEKVVANLLSNAIKYNKEGGTIGFNAELKNQQMTLTVTNENEELSENELPQLFDRFYQNNMLNPGAGIGLSLVKELVHLSKGSIVASKLNSGTILFTVTLPVAKGAFSNEDMVMAEKYEGNFESTEKESIALDEPIAEFEDNNLPVMLVIDDNEEIRLFIKTLFKKEYQILEAPNGEEGIKVAFKAVPDLIVSDIMMPVKDGIQLSNVLKNDERTSHIPIILLTAKSGEENELTGFKAGADAYLVKPFKEEKLRVIIKRLVATGEAIREKLNKQVILKPQEIELTDPDSLLLKRIQQILDDNLTDSEFNTASFCDQVGLSRMHLHRKLKALTGYAASEFIRVQRLKMAAKLLKDGHTHISEVGYAVGFNQPAYFSTAFKQHFGCSPSEYMDN